jgi:hypothetical protein
MHRLSSALNRHQAERRSASSIHILRARTRLPDRIMGGIITPAQYADLETWSRADMPVPQQGPVSSARLHNRGSSHREFDGLCTKRDRLKKSHPGPSKGNVLGGRSW